MSDYKRVREQVRELKKDRKALGGNQKQSEGRIRKRVDDVQKKQEKVREVLDQSTEEREEKE